MRAALWMLVLAGFAATLSGETSASGPAPEIRIEDLERDVRFLADDAQGGRLTGTEGIRRAADYIAAAFEQAGLVPVPGHDDYFQPFTFTSGVRLIEGGNRLGDFVALMSGLGRP